MLVQFGTYLISSPSSPLIRPSTVSLPSSNRKTRRSCASVTISKLQMKGIFTLSLFLFTNVVTADPAATVLHASRAAPRTDWTKTTNQDDDDDETNCHNIDNKDASSPSTTCVLAAPTNESTNGRCSPPATSEQSTPNTAFLQDSDDHDDMEDCPKCLQRCAELPRGGHMASSAAESVGSTAVAPYGIPLHAWKVIMQAFLTAINVICWLGPLQSKKIADNQLALSLANAFSGGVFLSLAFFHLIPECVHGFDSTWPETAPFAMVLAGYLIIFFVEKVAFDAHDILHEMQQGGGGGDSGHTTTTTSQDEAATKENGAVAEAPGHNSGRSAIILLGALGVHSVLEMMALGLSDTFGDAALLTTSIALHQPAESIALLVAFLKSGMPKAQIIQFLSIFSCMGPLGVALGMAVNEYAAPVVDSIMLAIVAGTFVYVGATEVIPEEWEDSTHKWKKFGALMGGIALIVAVTQYTAGWEP